MKCGTHLLPKIVRKPKLFAEKISQKELRKKDINVHTLFSEFLRLRNFDIGERIVYEHVNLWLTGRRNAYEYFRSKFTSNSATPQDIGKTYSDFLYFRNNRSWTTLYRTGKLALQHLERLRSLVKRLQDEGIPVSQRVNDGLTGRYKVKGIGKNILTAILHVCDKGDKYGVWNSRSEETLDKLGRLSKLTSNQGETYVRINSELNQLKTDLRTDLLTLDSFMWYVSEYYDID